MTRQIIDFAGLAAALLSRAKTLVLEWLPHGEIDGKYLYVGDFDGGKGRSANVNLETGGWGDNGSSGDSGRDLISLYARIHGLNNGQAALELMEMLGWSHVPDPPPRRPVQTSARAAAPAPASDDGRPEPPTADVAQAAPQQGSPDDKKNRWRPIVPVPDFAKPPRNFRFLYQDKKTNRKHELDAVHVWEYRLDGQLFGYVARFDRVTSSGGLDKVVISRTWCEDASNPGLLQGWHWKAWADPRPLYVPAGTLARGLPIVVVEGEKCADAGHELLGHEFTFVTWPGGCKTWALASWGWIAGASAVYLWPDADAKHRRLTKDEREKGVDPESVPIEPLMRQPGMKAMACIGTELQGKHDCASVFMVQMSKPADQLHPDGWDIADAIAGGWDQARVRDFIRGSSVFVSPDAPPRALVGHGADGDDGKKPPRSEAPAESDEDADRRGWRGYLLRTATTAAVQAVRENAVLALDGLPHKGVPGAEAAAGLIAFNEFTNNVEKLRQPPWQSGKPGKWEEDDELQMGDWLTWQCQMPSMGRQTLEEAVLMVSRRHAYHPVRERFLKLRGTWDGTPRLDKWLRVCCLEEDEYDDADPLQQYLSRAGKWFLMGMVARVMPTEKEGARIVRGPGTKFDYMLILEGPQGWGKSTLAAVLGGEYFADTGLQLGDKDSYQNIQGVLVYEWGELEGLSIADIRKVKSFVSSWKDRFRASFDRRPRDYPRQVVFIGTTNENHYLTDPSGNRRFWPLRLTRAPDLDWLREHLDQLIAEALHRLDARERFWPTKEEQRELFDPQQKLRTMESSLESSIRTYLYDEKQHVPHGGRDGTLVNEISLFDLLTAVGLTLDKQTDAVAKKAGALMHALGWEVKRSSKKDEDGKRPRHYVRPKASPPPAPPAAPASASHGTAPTQGPDDEDGDDCPF